MKPLILACALLSFAACTALAQEAGGDIYKAKCAGCHGPNGEGKVGPALKATKLGEDDIVLLLTKRQGRQKASAQ